MVSPWRARVLRPFLPVLCRESRALLGPGPGAEVFEFFAWGWTSQNALLDLPPGKAGAIWAEFFGAKVKIKKDAGVAGPWKTKDGCGWKVNSWGKPQVLGFVSYQGASLAHVFEPLPNETRNWTAGCIVQPVLG